MCVALSMVQDVETGRVWVGTKTDSHTDLRRLAAIQMIGVTPADWPHASEWLPWPSASTLWLGSKEGPAECARRLGLVKAVQSMAFVRPGMPPEDEADFAGRFIVWDRGQKTASEVCDEYLLAWLCPVHERRLHLDPHQGEIDSRVLDKLTPRHLLAVEKEANKRLGSSTSLAKWLHERIDAGNESGWVELSNSLHFSLHELFWPNGTAHDRYHAAVDGLSASALSRIEAFAGIAQEMPQEMRGPWRDPQPIVADPTPPEPQGDFVQGYYGSSKLPTARPAHAPTIVGLRVQVPSLAPTAAVLGKAP